MNALWQTLKIGDRVCCVSMPEDQLPDETAEVFAILVRTGAVLAVEEIDEFGHPWTVSFEIDATGTITTGSGMGHTLAIIDEAWERVESGHGPGQFSAKP